MQDNSEILRASLVRYFGLYGDVLDGYVAGLLKCNNVLVLTQTIEEMAKQNKGKKAPNVRTIRDAYFAVFKSPGEKQAKLQNCNYCDNTGYVLGLYDYQSRTAIPNKQIPVPTSQIEKIAFECFCGHCQGKDLESRDVREKRILKYGWDRNEADRFIGECCQLAQEITINP